MYREIYIDENNLYCVKFTVILTNLPRIETEQNPVFASDYPCLFTNLVLESRSVF
jgi:hypothetical protein